MPPKQINYCISLVFALFLSSFSVLFADSPHTLVVENIKIDETNDIVFVSIELNKPPEAKEFLIESHGAFLQIKLPNTLIPEPGKFYESKSPLFDKVAAFQINKSDGALRLFTKINAEKIKQASRLEVLDKRVIFSTEKNKVSIDNAQAVNTLNGSNQDKSLAPPSQHLFLGNRSNSQDSIKNYMRNAAWLSAILFVILIMTWLIKKKISQSTGHTYMKKQIEMKTISAINISPKQKLCLIQVGNEQILLACSQDKIEFIKTINDKEETPQSFASHLNFSPNRRSESQNFEQNFQDYRETRDSDKKEASVNTFNKELPPTTLDLKQPNKFKKPSFDPNTSDSSFKPAISKKQRKGQRIEVKIDDNGIHNEKIQPEIHKAKKETIEDITKLIRNKLNKLPS